MVLAHADSHVHVHPEEYALYGVLLLLAVCLYVAWREVRGDEA
jgi:hypothetical protein